MINSQLYVAGADSGRRQLCPVQEEAQTMREVRHTEIVGEVACNSSVFPEARSSSPLSPPCFHHSGVRRCGWHCSSIGCHRVSSALHHVGNHACHRTAGPRFPSFAASPKGLGHCPALGEAVPRKPSEVDTIQAHTEQEGSSRMQAGAAPQGTLSTGNLLRLHAVSRPGVTG